jgi:hypothetical protein
MPSLARTGVEEHGGASRGATTNVWPTIGAAAATGGMSLLLQSSDKNQE